MSIEAITFDFWQTLYRSRKIDFTERLRQLQSEVEAYSGESFSEEQFKVAVGTARQAWSAAWAQEQRTPNAREWLGVMLDHLGTELAAAPLQRIQHRMENSVLQERPHLEEDARPLLARLSSQYRLGLISDTGITPGRVLRQILEEDELLPYFTRLTFSDEVGRSKPHPDAFLTTLEALEASPAQAVHIGDLLRTDIAGARNVGMRGVQYIGVKKDDWSLPGDADPVTPDAVIERLPELEPLLDQW